MRRLILAALLLTGGPAVAQETVTPGKVNQGDGSGVATTWWTVRMSDGSSFLSVATDRTTAAGPFSFRLSDGAAFYDATKTGQLPAALVGGRLDANVGAWLGSTAPTVGQKTMANSLPFVFASDQTALPVTGAGTSSSFGAAFPATGTAIGFSDGTNMRQGFAVDFDSGAGAQFGQGINLRKITSGGSVEFGTSTDPVRTDPTGTTTQPISAASLPLPTGAATSANQDGIVRDGAGDTTQANVSVGRLHVDGSGVTQPVSAASLPLPTGASTLAEQQTQTTALQLIDDLMTGATMLSYISVGLTEDEHAVKASAGVLYSVAATSTNAAVRYLKCENDTAAGTAPGTDTPEFRLAIPGSTTGGGFTHGFPQGGAFSTAWTCWLVTGAADSDVAEVAANEIMVFYTFK